MVSLGNGLPGNRSGAYFFDDDSDDQSGSEISPLVHKPSTKNSPVAHVHIATGYLTAVEAISLFVYILGLVLTTLFLHNSDFLRSNNTSLWLDRDEPTDAPLQPAKMPDYIVACFAIAHVLVWGIVGVFDRIVQWRHQILRRKGYLKFYSKMKNIRRIPFIVVSIGQALVLVFVSLLYVFQVKEYSLLNGLRAVDGLYILVGVEMLIVEPCLIYYIARATWFNYTRQPPDVIKDTQVGPRGSTTSVSAVGFRDGEDLDELLERQADMIRYLQQHNANLGRRILELQSQNLE
ncbi:transmembrane protein 192-like [Halichondria panicea]|uniref:transmembrane protein 192-like n=1 Tax=Halichondria panicea TaxID=6063 RepID=UPI00312B9D6A